MARKHTVMRVTADWFYRKMQSVGWLALSPLAALLHAKEKGKVDLPLEPRLRIADVINAVAAQHGLSRYLEIGCDLDKTFNAVQMPHKIGVDPARGGNRRMTSDEFFAHNTEQFDIVLLDGLHWYEQTAKDYANAHAALANGGFIFIDDVAPPRAANARRQRLTLSWQGDVYKILYWLRALAAEYPSAMPQLLLAQKAYAVTRKNGDIDFARRNVADYAHISHEQLAKDIGAFEIFQPPQK